MNKLLSLCYSVFEIATVFTEQTGGQNVGRECGNKIIQALEKLDQELKLLSLSETQRSNVKYALVAFVDEAIVNSDCDWREEWMVQPLQLRYFGEHLAGENFFVRLQSLCAAVKENIDVIEIYYLCLLLGFEGKYRMHDRTQLKLLIEDVAYAINSVRGAKKLCMYVDAPMRGEIKRDRLKNRLWLGFGLILFLSGIIYFANYAAISHQAALVQRLLINGGK